jgi:hypothetical protein
MNEALLVRQRRTIDELERVISDAADIAGEMSILFPAKQIKVTQKSRPTWEVKAMQAVGFSMFDTNRPADISFRIQKLRVMLGQIDRSALTDAVHFKIEFGDKRWGYALSDSAVRSMPKQVAVRNITESLGRVIGLEIARAVEQYHGIGDKT